MGRESRARKARKCEACGQVMKGDAQVIAEHGRLCKRAQAIGLSLENSKIIAVPKPKKSKDPWGGYRIR